MGKSYLINQFSPVLSHIIIQRSDGEFVVDAGEVVDIAMSLLELAKRMEGHRGTTDRESFDQLLYRSDAAQALAVDVALAPETLWYFSPNMIAQPADPSPPPTEHPSAPPLCFLENPCVYFIQAAVYNGLIKIGSTTSLTRRQQQLEKAHFDTSFEILAICQTPQYKDLEKYLHYQLYASRVIGEFFKEGAVKWYLNYVSGLIANR